MVTGGRPFTYHRHDGASLDMTPWEPGLRPAHIGEDDLCFILRADNTSDTQRAAIVPWGIGGNNPKRIVAYYVLPRTP